MISIVVPLYNKEAAILSSLSSIQGQNYKEWECVIVDDGSTDASAKIVQDFIRDDTRFVYYYKQNGGPSSARNYGIDRANGDWIVFLDADDIFATDALSVFDDAIREHCRYNCIAFNFYVDKDGVCKLYSQLQTSVIMNPYKEWYYKRFMPRTGAAIFKKDILLTHKHKEYLRRFEDAELLFNIFRKERFFYVNIPVMTYLRENSAASGVRKVFQEDFFAHIHPQGKPFWEQMILYQYYKASFTLYGEQASKTYPNSPFNPIIEVTIKCILAWSLIKKRVTKIFCK